MLLIRFSLFALAVLLLQSHSKVLGSQNNDEGVNVMNRGGVPYKIANPEGSVPNWKGTPGTYPIDFKLSVEGDVESFDVYGEVQTRYSQVYWTRNAPINLPPEIVERFKGKVMAIVGYEVDQVTHPHAPHKKDGAPSQGPLSGFSCYPSCDEEDASVPIYHAYNHHYFSWLQGSDAEMYDLEEYRRIPNPTKTAFRDKPDKSHSYPSNIVFKENPGGEFRKSYHGYPSGYAQLIASPTQWIVEPMQIDTHPRTFNITDNEGYKPSFIPKIQSQNRTVTDYEDRLSPLIECPCSDRITKTTEVSPVLKNAGTCGSPIASVEECSKAITDMGAKISRAVKTVTNASMPSGCLLVPETGGHQLEGVFNEQTSSQATCESGRGSFAWSAPMNSTKIDCVGGTCLPSDQKFGCTGEFQGQCTWDDAETAKSMCGKYEECLGFFCSKNYGSKLLCFGRGVQTTARSSFSGDQAWVKRFSEPLQIGGTAVVEALPNFSVNIDRKGDETIFTMSGPADVWFGVGFNAKTMSDLPYAIIVDGAGVVSERKLGNHAPGAALKSSFTVISSEKSSGVRTVKFSRPSAGLTSDHWAVPSSAGIVNLIAAIGSQSELSYHKAKTDASILLLPNNVETCICAPQKQSFINYMNASKIGFNGYNCLPEPRSYMHDHGDTTGRNVPNQACDVATYHGGLQCCKHSWFLTDLDQDSMIPEAVDTYYLKWRYYFQEYVPATPAKAASHLHLKHWVFLIDAIVNDYEEDNAHYGEASVGKLEARLTGRDIGLEETPSNYSKITWFVMTPHYHAPNSIREELWNADTGEIICNASGTYGSSTFGSTNKVFNEASYIAITPCLFGYQTGLQFPFSISPDTNLLAKKYVNNTYRHLGQMAQWTVSFAFFLFDILSFRLFSFLRLGAHEVRHGSVLNLSLKMRIITNITYFELLLDTHR